MTRQQAASGIFPAHAGSTSPQVQLLHVWADHLRSRGKHEGVAPGKTFVGGALENQFVGISINSTQPGGTSPFWHTHAQIKEIYVFLEGTGVLALDDDLIEVGPRTLARVRQDVWRGLRCTPGSEVPFKWLCLRASGAKLAEILNDAEIDQERPWAWD